MARHGATGLAIDKWRALIQCVCLSIDHGYGIASAVNNENTSCIDARHRVYRAAAYGNPWIGRVGGNLDGGDHAGGLAGG